MGIVKTETFIDENSMEMRKDTYANGMTITHPANSPEMESESVYIPTEQETTASKLDYLLMMEGSE